MTLTWFRAQRYLPAAALLVSLAALLAVPHAGSPHHDADAGIVARAHDAAAERIGRASTDPRPPEHCAVCHWARGFRLLTQIGTLTTPPPEALTVLTLDAVRRTIAGTAAPPSLRGPPASPIA